MTDSGSEAKYVTVMCLEIQIMMIIGKENVIFEKVVMPRMKALKLQSIPSAPL